jgi:nucleoside-diphosphate-sugar epimerase
VLHLATRIPPSSAMGKPEAWADNDRLRTEGTRNLVHAALAGQVQTFIYPSVVLVYPDSGDAWIDAQSTPPDAIAFVRSTLEAEAQVQRFARAGRRGITLRMGNFYGPESGHTRDILAYARKGLAAVLGPAEAYQSSIWIEDAARAVLAALDQAPSGTYDVVDNEPLQRSELMSLIGRAAGKTRLWRLPDSLMRLMLGKDLVAVNSRSQRVSNRAFREATGWMPQVRSARDGWQRLADVTPAAQAHERLATS